MRRSLCLMLQKCIPLVRGSRILLYFIILFHLGKYIVWIQSSVNDEKLEPAKQNSGQPCPVAITPRSQQTWLEQANDFASHLLEVLQLSVWVSRSVRLSCFSSLYKGCFATYHRTTPTYVAVGRRVVTARCPPVAATVCCRHPAPCSGLPSRCCHGQVQVRNFHEAVPFKQLFACFVPHFSVKEYTVAPEINGRCLLVFSFYLYKMTYK